MYSDYATQVCEWQLSKEIRFWWNYLIWYKGYTFILAKDRKDIFYPSFAGCSSPSSSVLDFFKDTLWSHIVMAERLRLERYLVSLDHRNPVSVKVHYTGVLSASVTKALGWGPRKSFQVLMKTLIYSDK